ncbi:MAG: efflux RND transporter periplasmic adaptor subunit [Planctomycetes bacterium]|nr:efflux RND transporter periplasmic adaptor subunit [Planctomycetota bacterium]
MSKVDLSALRMTEKAAPAPRRPLAPRLVTVAFLLLAIAVVLSFAWPLLSPTRAVPMARVAAGEASTTASTTAAEAVGWVEADPFPVWVRPLVRGRIEAIEVLEGALVEQGKTVIARLQSAELLAARDRAQATAAEKQRAATVAEAELQLARERLAQNGEARLRLVEAQTMLHQLAGRVATATSAVPKAAAMVSEATATATAQDRLAEAGSSNEVARERAHAAVAAAEAAHAAAAAELEAVGREFAAAQERVALATELRDGPVDLRQGVAIAERSLERAHAAAAAAATEVAIAERELNWTEVLAPASGVVMRLDAAPGMITGPGAEPIVAVYDPSHLRARIDVPFGSVAAVHAGQQVQIRCESLGNAVVRGVVQRLQHESDLLKNTLQVKVELIDPPPLLRPETLVRANFLADAAQQNSGPSSFRVPRAAVAGDKVFVFDPVARAARAVPVQVVGERDGDALVTGELSVAQQVVLVPVKDGERIEEQQP